MMLVEKGRLNVWKVTQPFKFPWVHYSSMNNDWYFEMVLFHRCINVQLNKRLDK